MVTLILLLIIAILVGFILWILKEFFVIAPKEESAKVAVVDKAAEKRGDCQEVSESVKAVVGATNYKPLVAVTPISKKIVPPEEIESAFMNNDFESEYDSEPPMPTELPEEEQTEVLDVEQRSVDAAEDDLNIQKPICTDYEQIGVAVKKVIRSEPLDINDAETMRALSNTSIGDQIERRMPHYLQIVQAAFINV